MSKQYNCRDCNIDITHLYSGRGRPPVLCEECKSDTLARLRGHTVSKPDGSTAYVEPKLSGPEPTVQDIEIPAQPKGSRKSDYNYTFECYGSFLNFQTASKVADEVASKMTKAGLVVNMKRVKGFKKNESSG